jgi:FkbM family methyltransferase
VSAINNFVSYALSHPVGRKTPVRTMARILAWQVKSRMAAGPFVEPWIGDSRLVVERSMVGATGNLYFGLHEFSDMGFLLHVLRPGDLFLDVGANIGSFTILAAKVCGAECWAFEPSCATLKALEANIAANAVDGHVHIHRYALGAKEGIVHFTRDLGPMNGVATEASSNTDEVSIKRLDDVIGDAAPIMMKIDVEGHEPALFDGAMKALALPSLCAIEVETVTDPMAAQLSALGYHRRYYDPFTRALTVVPGSSHGNNLLFIRNEDMVRERLASAPSLRFMGVTL